MFLAEIVSVRTFRLVLREVVISLDPPRTICYVLLL